MSRFLLDSHVLLWWADNPQLLSDDARCTIADGRNWIYVSVATIWELGIKQTTGKLTLPDNCLSLIKANRFDVLNITAEHAIAATELPRHHGDPFDRMLIGQATSDQLTLITRDRNIAKYAVSVMGA